MIWLELAIIRRAMIGCALTGFLTGLIGVFVVRMRLTSIGYSMSHGAFAGAALGVAVSANPLSTSILFSAVTALLIGPVADKARLSQDTITSIAFPLNMALAFIFLALSPQIGLSSEVASVLWGSVISISNSDILYLAILCITASILIHFFWKELFTIMFDRRLAEADGINTKPFVYLMIFLIGIVITLSIKLVGGLLVFALLFNTASTTLQFLQDMKKIVLFSPIAGSAMCVSGLVASLAFDLPVGSCIVLVSTIAFAVSILLSPKRKRKEVKESS
ncbi:MAG: metal ABC transporter permease [Candidatus Brockarchaeota archaeon]|nr:metal ABC transporter permease [Candidatus Brockarchaeota archaeon]